MWPETRMCGNSNMGPIELLLVIVMFKELDLKKGENESKQINTVC